MASESPYPPIDVPNIDIWEFLFERKKDFPVDKGETSAVSARSHRLTQNFKVVFVDHPTRRQYTFLDIKETAVAFGHALRTQWNWQKGDVLGMCTPNCVDMPALMWGTLWAGGIVSPSNPAYTPAELAFQLKDSGAKALLTQVSHLKIAFEAAKIAGIPRDRILTMGNEKSGAAQHFTYFIASAKGKPMMERVVQGPNDSAYIPYSSGTTGLPKGVVLTQGNMVSNTLMCRVGLSELSSKDTMLAVLPFYHVYG
jgi:4-coumarate--CoA ligase